jgi:osmotically-inducible protein OsmY
MKKMIYLICFLISYNVFAATMPSDTPTQPTESSNPIPSLAETQNPDTVITEKVQAAIKDNAVLANQAVSAASNEGKVILQGSVASKEQETEAINTAKTIKGVKEVESQLTIKNN